MSRAHPLNLLSGCVSLMTIFMLDVFKHVSLLPGFFEGVGLSTAYLCIMFTQMIKKGQCYKTFCIRNLKLFIIS